MKLVQSILAPILLCLSSTLLSAQTGQIEKTDLDALEEKPKKIAPEFFLKSASKGPVVEEKREYIFTSEGANGTQSKAARVISMSDGTKIEAPLVDIPLLFKKNQAILANTQSQANLKLLAGKLKSLPSAKFCIEGHASAEGEKSHNQKLSEARARTIRQALELMGVPNSSFTTTTGRGSSHAQHPAHSSESNLAKDRRVLLIREQ
jgi:outer membrane protein OmpA-like peptidoglycan-associated protein